VGFAAHEAGRGGGLPAGGGKPKRTMLPWFNVRESRSSCIVITCTQQGPADSCKQAARNQLNCTNAMPRAAAKRHHMRSYELVC
jgi:hypothetical protein